MVLNGQHGLWADRAQACLHCCQEHATSCPQFHASELVHIHCCTGLPSCFRLTPQIRMGLRFAEDIAKPIQRTCITHVEALLKAVTVEVLRELTGERHELFSESIFQMCKSDSLFLTSIQTSQYHLTKRVIAHIKSECLVSNAAASASEFLCTVLGSAVHTLLLP